MQETWRLRDDLELRVGPPGVFFRCSCGMPVFPTQQDDRCPGCGAVYRVSVLQRLDPGSCFVLGVCPYVVSGAESR